MKIDYFMGEAIKEAKKALKNNGLNKTYYSYLLEKISYLKVRENLELFHTCFNSS